MKISGNKWFLILGIKTVFLTILYIVLHFVGNYKDVLKPQNTKLEYLSGEQILVITEFNKTISPAIDSSLTLNKRNSLIKDSVVRENMFKYVSNLYPDIEISEIEKLKAFISTIDLTNIKPLLSNYPIRIRSLFWLGSSWIYLELTFWALFGVLANLLYNVAEQLRKKAFCKEEIPVHVSKIIYSPFCVIIIYICYNTINKDTGTYEIQYTQYSLAVAFLLGFFSGRMIDLLNRIKDVLLPLGKGSTDGIDENNVADTELEDLPTADHSIIEEAITEKGKDWVNSFPKVTGFAIRNKSTKGKDVKNDALVFKVTKKEKNIEFGKIPTLLSYSAKNGIRYKIITDVVEETMPTPNITAVNANPFPLGNSISRDNHNGTGTIGLLLKKKGDLENKYIISCYHVFCAPELEHENKTFFDTSNSAAVRSASVMDGGTNGIGFIVHGKMDSISDFAVAKLNKNYIVSATIHGWNISPNGFGHVLSWHKGKTVKMCGRTSGQTSGQIKSHFAPQVIDYLGVTQYYERLIEIDRISEPGDSGAAVLDENNLIIGLLIANSDSSSYVLPVSDFISTNNYFL